MIARAITLGPCGEVGDERLRLSPLFRIEEDVLKLRQHAFARVDDREKSWPERLRMGHVAKLTTSVCASHPYFA